jgi:hypothetical protein
LSQTSSGRLRAPRFQEAWNPRFTECVLRPSVLPTVGLPPGWPLQRRKRVLTTRRRPRVELSSIATSTCGLGHVPPSASPGQRSSRARYGQRVAQPTGRPSRCQVRRAPGGGRRRATDRRDSVPPADVAPTPDGGRYPAFARWPSRSGPCVRFKRVPQTLSRAHGPPERCGLPDGDAAIASARRFD